jgi:hypothetical protein
LHSSYGQSTSVNTSFSAEESKSTDALRNDKRRLQHPRLDLSIDVGIGLKNRRYSFLDSSTVQEVPNIRNGVLCSLQRCKQID